MAQKSDSIVQNRSLCIVKRENGSFPIYKLQFPIFWLPSYVFFKLIQFLFLILPKASLSEIFYISFTNLQHPLFCPMQLRCFVQLPNVGQRKSKSLSIPALRTGLLPAALSGLLSSVFILCTFY